MHNSGDVESNDRGIFSVNELQGVDIEGTRVSRIVKKVVEGFVVETE